jgi:two-component system, chemotaxis family, protein-glutamate methylesterase/glutaminase
VTPPTPPTQPTPVRLVVVGGSWGGAAAATGLLRAVPSPLPVPVLLVLHRSRSSEAALLERVLERDTGHPVCELVDKDELSAGTVHLAPPDYHVLVEGGSVSLSVEEHVNHSRPSLDLAFESAADEHGPALVAVVLSGLGRDGAHGIAAVHRAGGRTLVQDPAEAERGDMPRAAIETGEVDEVAPVAGLGARVADLVGAPS